jgi:serine/threonine protein phosphatase PrpC
MIPSDQPHLRVSAVSNSGRVRDHNEDSYGVTAYRLKDDKTPVLLAVLADGIGGHQAGEVASKLTVDTVVAVLESQPTASPLAALRAAVVEAAREVRQAATGNKAREGMGSTLAVAWIIGRKLYTVNVGDSRIYFRREGDLHRISIDHTWIQEALDHGIIQPDEVEGHPNAHVLRRHIGGAKPPEPDFRLRLKLDETDDESVANQGLMLQAGDQLLLCSDGLTDLVSGPDIDAALAQHGPDATQDLLQLALQRGGHDNITIIVLEAPKPVSPSGASLPTRA